MWLPIVPATIAHELFLREAPCTPRGTTAPLDAAIAKMRTRVVTDGSERHRAMATLQAIADTLSELHFAFPARGYVLTMHEGLATLDVDAQGRARLLASLDNEHRKQMLETAQGLHLADCDIFSFIYVAIGEELGLPISVAELPSTEAEIGHTYVTWSLADGSWISWEASVGEPRDLARDKEHVDGDVAAWNAKAHAYSRPLTRDEMRAEMRVLVSDAAARIGANADEVSELKAALALNPLLPNALNSLAWTLATTPDPTVRDPAAAVSYAERAIADFPTADHLDTLAAAYAASGRWADAQATQKRAMRAGDWFGEDAPLKLARLHAYEKCQVYLDSRWEEQQGLGWGHELRNWHWFDLRVAPVVAVPTEEPAPDLCKKR
jgi:tetratricopeptide (TPR) repeat protein